MQILFTGIKIVSTSSSQRRVLFVSSKSVVGFQLQINCWTYAFINILNHSLSRLNTFINKMWVDNINFKDYIEQYSYSTGLHIDQQAEAWWKVSIWRSHRKVVIRQCSYHNSIIDIQNRLPYSKVVYPAIIVLFSCPMEVNHGVGSRPNYPFR